MSTAITKQDKTPQLLAVKISLEKELLQVNLRSEINLWCSELAEIFFRDESREGKGQENPPVIHKYLFSMYSFCHSVFFRQLWQLQRHSSNGTTPPAPEMKLIHMLGWADEGLQKKVLMQRAA